MNLWVKPFKRKNSVIWVQLDWNWEGAYLEQPQVLPNSIGCSLKPISSSVTGSLGSCQDLHKTIAKVDFAEVIGASKMAVKRSGVELGEDENFVDSAIDTVTHGHIN